MKKVILIISIIAVSIFSFMVLNKKPKEDLFPKELISDGSTEILNSNKPTELSDSVVGDLKQHKDIGGKFTFYYPKDLSSTLYRESEGVYTIVFKDNSGEKGFQVSVIPYDQKTISTERFKLDIPLGVASNVTEILIDGIRAVMFFSRNNLLGETREVWFINKGYLYEVVAPKNLDSWLSQIMATWKFSKN